MAEVTKIEKLTERDFNGKRLPVVEIQHQLGSRGILVGWNIGFTPLGQEALPDDTAFNNN